MSLYFLAQFWAYFHTCLKLLLTLFIPLHFDFILTLFWPYFHLYISLFFLYILASFFDSFIELIFAPFWINFVLADAFVFWLHLYFELIAFRRRFNLHRHSVLVKQQLKHESRAGRWLWSLLDTKNNIKVNMKQQQHRVWNANWFSIFAMWPSPVIYRPWCLVPCYQIKKLQKAVRWMQLTTTRPFELFFLQKLSKWGVLSWTLESYLVTKALDGEK